MNDATCYNTCASIVGCLSFVKYKIIKMHLKIKNDVNEEQKRGKEFSKNVYILTYWKSKHITIWVDFRIILYCTLNITVWIFDSVRTHFFKAFFCPFPIINQYPSATKSLSPLLCKDVLFIKTYEWRWCHTPCCGACMIEYSWETIQ